MTLNTIGFKVWDLQSIYDGVSPPTSNPLLKSRNIDKLGWRRDP